jgi:hypothetical protein
MASTSTDFKYFIKRKKESHRENAIDYTPESLMLAAENHYNAMKLNGEWNGVTVDPPLVLALRAQIKDMEKRNHRNGGGDGGGGGGGGRGRLPPVRRLVTNVGELASVGARAVHVTFGSIGVGVVVGTVATTWCV